MDNSKTTPPEPVDCNGRRVAVGSLVRVLSLAGDWFDKLPRDERASVASMVGEVFPIEEIDEYGSPWVCKNWPNEAAGTHLSHSVALASNEMEYVGEAAGSDKAL